MELSEAIAEAYASAPFDDHIIYTIEINHQSFTEPIRIAQCPTLGTDGINSIKQLKLETGELVDFIGSAFEIKLPELGSKNAGTFEFRFFGVAQYIETYLENASLSGGAISATYREFLSSNGATQGPELVWPNIAISSPTTSGLDIVCQGAVFNWIKRAYGSLYTPGEYPALVRGR